MKLKYQKDKNFFNKTKKKKEKNLLKIMIFILIIIYLLLIFLITQIIHPPPLIRAKSFPESESEVFLEEKIEKIDESAVHFYEDKENGKKYKSRNDLIYDI